MLMYYHYHTGHGFGSFFAKLLSKVAAKGVAKSLGRVVKTAGRKAIKAAVSPTAKRLVKKAVKKGIEEVTKAGADYTINKIQSLEDAAIKAGAPSDLIHNISATARVGARSGAKKLKDIGIKRSNDFVDNFEPVKKKKRLSYNVEHAL